MTALTHGCVLTPSGWAPSRGHFHSYTELTLHQANHSSCICSVWPDEGCWCFCVPSTLGSKLLEERATLLFPSSLKTPGMGRDPTVSTAIVAVPPPPWAFSLASCSAIQGSPRRGYYELLSFYGSGGLLRQQVNGLCGEPPAALGQHSAPIRKCMVSTGTSPGCLGCCKTIRRKNCLEKTSSV